MKRAKSDAMNSPLQIPGEACMFFCQTYKTMALTEGGGVSWLLSTLW